MVILDLVEESLRLMSVDASNMDRPSLGSSMNTVIMDTTGKLISILSNLLERDAKEAWMDLPHKKR